MRFGYPDCLRHNQSDVDIGEILEEIMPSNDSSVFAFLDNLLLPLDFYRPDLPGHSNIAVARTFHGTSDPYVSQLHCPLGQFLISIVLTDANMSIANDSKSLIDGQVAAGNAFVTRPGKRLVINAQCVFDLLHLAVDSTVMDQSACRRFILDTLVLHDQIIGRIGKALSEAPAEWLRLYAELLSQLLVTRLLQLVPEPPAGGLLVWRLKKVQAFVENNIDAPLRLADLAAAAGLSRMHFASQFRLVTGTRPHEYVLSRRIERAKQLMAQSEATLVQIALDVGFQSQAHFCTIFKRLIGITPSVWRHRFAMARVCVWDIKDKSEAMQDIRFPPFPTLPNSIQARELRVHGFTD